MSEADCPFCDYDGEVLFETHDVVAFLDRYPVTPGHALIVPRRHHQRWQDLDHQIQHQLFEAIGIVMLKVDGRHDSDPAARADGFNVGFNDGPAAGQTIGHFHIHVIPRRQGDMEDPRGGIRWVIPDKADYWS